ncbi:unnamed protein product [Medioppia subpectinata]|uniref:Uncharacterized protein n=1 Tax=Medioppia subpectinata TaxID=1979941 RepID=A0A7R9Q893_9ACAR|nr:unnamed protein product [Medioppia subpectinata]CAG2115110.1 unnamed protein product [Medioppia subpectinata]
MFRTEKLKLRLLSEQEFELQSDVQTREALQQLKKFCISSECNAWNTICKLKDPIRFARFIDGENHISDDEIIAYESSQMNNSLIALNHNNNEDESDDEYQELQ